MPKEFESKPDPAETNFDILKALFKVRKKLKMLISMKPESKSREKSILIIDTDIPRTFSSVEGFQSEKNCADLAKVLRAFAMYRPDVGYVQGMSYVAGMLLMHMQEPFMTFVTFCSLASSYPFLPFYSFDDIRVRKTMQLYKQVFAYNLPDLCEHFELENI